jgi:isopenicillin N synthase-like dioxygenase
MAKSEIPIIDISEPSPTVAQQVLDAACTHGFLFIKNDGSTIPQADIDEMFNLVRLDTNLKICVMIDTLYVHGIL